MATCRGIPHENRSPIQAIAQKVHLLNHNQEHIMNFLTVSDINSTLEFVLDILANREHEAVIQAGDVIPQFKFFSKSRQTTLQKVIPGSNRVASEIVQTQSGTFPKQKQFKFHLQRTFGAQFATSINAGSEEEAIALTLELLKLDIVLIPIRKASGDCRMVSLCISYSIEILDQDVPKEKIGGKHFNKFVTTENQLQLHGSEHNTHPDASLSAWRLALVRAYQLNPVEEKFVLDLPFIDPSDSPAKRLADVLAVRT